MNTAARWAPGGIPLGIALLALSTASPELLSDIAGQYRWAVYGLTGVLAWAFHRSRVFVAVLWLAALDSVVSQAPETDLMGSAGGVAVALLGLLALSRDRGVTSRTGAGQVAASVVLMGIPALLFADSVNVDAFALVALVPAAVTSWTGFAQATLLLGLLGLAASGWAAYRWNGPVERGVVWGQVAVLTAAHPAVVPPGDSLLLVSAGLILAIAVLENSYAMAYRDDLTGLPSRRALMRDIEALGGAYTLAMVDVDHFKKFNDRHGHDVGDQVLRLVAGCLARTGGGARAYRYGGEEFTIVFEGMPKEEALGHLEEARLAVSTATFALRGWNRPHRKPAAPRSTPDSRRLSVTVSVGASEADANDVPAAVLKRADQALYRAKKAGRDRVSG